MPDHRFIPSRSLFFPVLLSLLAHVVLIGHFLPRFLRPEGARVSQTLLHAQLANAARDASVNAGGAVPPHFLPRRQDGKPETHLMPSAVDGERRLAEEKPVVAERSAASPGSRSDETRPSVIAVETVVGAGDMRAYRLALGGEIARLQRQYQERFADAERESRHGIAGRVEFVLRVVPTGAAQLGLSKSSGHRRLDDEARGLFLRAVQTTELPRALRGQSFALPLVMEFQLDD